MLKGRTHSESCLVALNSSSAASEEPRSLQSTASIPEGSVAASEGSAQSGIDADLLSTMRFNDSAYAEGGDTQHVMQSSPSWKYHDATNAPLVTHSMRVPWL